MDKHLKYVKIHDGLIDLFQENRISKLEAIEFLMAVLASHLAFARLDTETLTEAVCYFHNQVAEAVEKLQELDKLKTKPTPPPEPDPTPEEEEMAYRLAMETLQKMTGK